MNAKVVPLFVVITALLWPFAVEAAPISVQLIEGNYRGFLLVRSSAGAAIAYGEMSQKPTGSLVECRMVLKFKDGSLYDEAATFSQKGVFRLERYRRVQHGPSFPALEVSFDRKSGQYKALCQMEKNAKQKMAGGTFEMPTDLYNGMALILLKNLPGGAGATVHLAVFTPEPRLIDMEWRWEGEDEVLLGGRSMKAMRSLVKLKIGGLAGVIASLAGKTPPDQRYWIVTGDVPAFVRFEGAMFLNGPVWRIEMTTVEWPK